MTQKHILETIVNLHHYKPDYTAKELKKLSAYLFDYAPKPLFFKKHKIIGRNILKGLVDTYGSITSAQLYNALTGNRNNAFDKLANKLNIKTTPIINISAECKWFEINVEVPEAIAEERCTIIRQLFLDYERHQGDPKKPAHLRVVTEKIC